MNTIKVATKNQSGLRRRILFCVTLAPLASLGVAADGDLDNGFGTAGVVDGTPVTPVNFQAQILHRVSSVATPDGAVLILGTRPHRITRFLSGGTPDATFGVGGTTAEPAGDQGDAGTALLQSTNGDLFSVAHKTDLTSAGVVVCRFTASGVPANFSAVGTPCVERLIVEPTPAFWPRDAALDVEEGIVVVGRDARLLRFTAAGSSDMTIGPDGVHVVEPADVLDQFHVIEDIKIDGEAIFLTGWLDNDGSNVAGIIHKLRLQLAQVGPPPQPAQPIVRDPVFNGGNYMLMYCGTTPVSLCQLRAAVVTGETLTLAGSGQYNALYGVVARIDKTTGGKAGPTSVLTMTATPGTQVQLRDMVAQSDGGIVVAGTLGEDADLVDYDQAIVARIDAGCPNPVDEGFGSAGWSAFTYFVDQYSTGTSVVLGTNRIYVAGYTDFNAPITETVAALVNDGVSGDGLFADDFENPCN